MDLRGRHDLMRPSASLRARLLVLALVVLAACGSDGGEAVAPPSASPEVAIPSSSPTSAGATVQDVIDLGGEEALGLAVTDDAVWAISYRAGTLSRVDPSTGTVTGAQELAAAATVLAAEGSLWVAGYGGTRGESTVYRVDPGSGAAVATIDPGEVCCDLSAGDGAVWAVDPRGSVLRIDPGLERVVQRFEVPIDRTVHTNAVFAGGSVWVSSDSTPLFRLHPGSGAVETVETGGGVPFLQHEGLVWGAAPSLLWAVDAATGEVVETVPLEDSMEVLSLGLGFGAIWVGIRHPGYVGAVLRLDPATGAVLDELGDVQIPARIGFGFGSVWVTDSGSSSLYRISPGA